MAKFVDSLGREWIVDVTVDKIKKVRKALDIDLADASGEVVHQLSEDIVLMADALWLLCEDQAIVKKITDEEFGRGLVGDPLDAAAGALVEAISDFSPGQRRLLLQKATAKMRAVREKAESLALAKLDDPKLTEQLEAALMTRMDAEMQAALTRLNGPTSSQGKSAESTQVP